MSYQVHLIEVPDNPKMKVVYLKGEIDESNLDDFKKEFAPMLSTDGVDVFIMHLRDLEFINSMTIGYFAGVYSDLHGQSKKLMLAEANEHIFDILNLVGFTNLAEYHATLREAIDSVNI